MENYQWCHIIEHFFDDFLVRDVALEVSHIIIESRMAERWLGEIENDNLGLRMVLLEMFYNGDPDLAATASDKDCSAVESHGYCYGDCVKLMSLWLYI